MTPIKRHISAQYQLVGLYFGGVTIGRDFTSGRGPRWVRWNCHERRFAYASFPQSYDAEVVDSVW